MHLTTQTKVHFDDIFLLWRERDPGGAVPSNRLMGMCRLMADYNEVGSLRGQRHLPSKNLGRET